MIRALAITISNRAAAGIYADKSGPVLAGLPTAVRRVGFIGWRSRATRMQ